MTRIVLVLSAALIFAADAFGAYAPRLSASHVGNGVQVSFRQASSDDATANFFVTPPVQYRATLNHAPGTTIGRVTAEIEVRALGGIPITLEGTVVADDPANHAGQRCIPVSPQAVWIATLGVPGQQPIRIPIFVGGLGGASMVACLPSPDVPESEGGAPQGAKLLRATFLFQQVFTPPVRGDFAWFGSFLPYVSGTSTPNTAAAVQSRALIRTPAAISLRGERETRAGKQVAALSGVVTEAGIGVAGAVVRIRSGRVTRTARTSTRGRYSITVPLARTTTFTAFVTVAERDVTGTECPPCANASAAGFQASSRPVRVVRARVKSKR